MLINCKVILLTTKKKKKTTINLLDGVRQSLVGCIFGVQICNQPKSHTWVLLEYSEIVLSFLTFTVNFIMNLMNGNIRGGSTIHCTSKIPKNYSQSTHTNYHAT